MNNLKKIKQFIKKRKIFIGIFIIILIAISLIFIQLFSIENLVYKSPVKISCEDFVKSFSIEEACHLNDNEVEIKIKRNIGNFYLERIKFEFQPSDSLWKVDGTKCEDIKLKNKNYGNYCEVIDEGEELSYILNLSLGKQNKIKLIVEGNGLDCEINEKEIKEQC